MKRDGKQRRKDLGIYSEEARPKAEAEEQKSFKAEEEVQISQEAMLKSEEHKRAWMKVEEEVLLTLEARRQAEEEGVFATEI